MNEINIKVGNKIKLNNEYVIITGIINNVGFYYSNGVEEKFCNTMFETLNFKPIFE